VPKLPVEALDELWRHDVDTAAEASRLPERLQNFFNGDVLAEQLKCYEDS